MMTSLRRLFTSVAILAAGFMPHFIPSAQAAEIQVLYNTTEIVDGSSIAAVADGTFFGVQTVGAGNLTRTFTIKNTSATAGDSLNLTGTPRAVIGGANPGDFVVTTQPATPVAPNGSTTVVITWTPTFGGIHNATLSIANNDSNENPYNFAIQATAQLKLTYTAGANGSLSGTTPQVVFSTATGSAVTAVPATGYHFVNWSDFSSVNPRTDTPVTANVNVTANFASGGYTLTYAAGANGSINGTTSQTVVHAASGTAVTAVPATGYSFVNWSDDSTANPRTDTNVMTSKSVTATFAINTYTLTYTAGANGSITGTTPQTVNYNTSGTAVTAVPATGYSFVNWSDGVLTAARTDTNVTANKSVTANFAINTYTLTYTAGANGSITGTTLQTVNYNTSGTAVTAVPATGYRFVKWSDNSTANPRTDTNVTASKSVTANFELKAPTAPVPTVTLNGPATVTMGVNGAYTELGAFSGPSALAAGGYHSLALRSDGTVVAWGQNTSGQTTIPLGLSNVVAVSAGLNHSLALRSDGTVVAWGQNTYGQTTIPLGLSNVVAISAGKIHSLALCGDGTVVAWGFGGDGQTNTAGFSNVVAISAGGSYSLALRSDGTVVGSGYTTIPPGLSNVVAIAAGLDHSLALRSDGTVAAWGTNTSGQTTVPPGLSNVVAIAAGWSHSLALRSDGTVAAWGYNGDGQTNTAGLSNVVALASGGNHNLALRSGGTVVGWGNNTNSQTTIPTNVYLPAAVSGSVNTNTPGSYVLTYSATNFLGGIGSTTRTVVVVAPFTLTYAAGANGSLTGTTPQTVNYGASGTAVTAVPATGYSFVNWSDSSTANPRTDANVTANKSVTANFAINTYTLTYAAGANGSLTGTTPQTVNHGASGTAVTAVPATGYSFVNWSDGSTANPRTDTNVTAAKSVTANFAINTFTLTYTAGANGSLSGTTPQTVNYNASGTAVTAVPATGYSFVNWSDGSTANPRTDTNVTAVKSVTANFAINTYTLTYTAGANGSLTGTTPQTVNYGASGTAVIAVPATGYSFVNWSDSSTANPRTDANVTATKSVTANFAINTYTLTYTAGANGSLNGTTPQTVNYNTSGTAVTAVPATGYRFVKWSDNSTANPRTDTNVTASKSVTANFELKAPTAPVPTVTLNGPATVTIGVNTAYTELGAFSGPSALAAGQYHSLALRSDGTVFGWGGNFVGQVTIPAGLSNVVALAAGGAHNLALRSDGTVAAWGFNAEGQTTIPAGLSNVVAISAGQYHSLALRSDGTAVVWGDNSFYQKNIPAGLSNVVAISAGGYHSLALRNDGTVAAWGFNSFDQTTIPAGLSNVVALAAGGLHSLALRSDGTVAAWGYNADGQTTTPAGLSNVVALAAGGLHSLALRSDGTVVAWGDNSFGQSTIPEGLSNVVAIAAGGEHSLALRSDGTVVAWGNNTYGQTTIPANAYLPAAVSGSVVTNTLGSYVLTYSATNFLGGSGSTTRTVVVVAPYTLTYTAGANGSLNGTTPQTVNYNASGTTVTAIPSTGYSFVNWSDGSTANPRTDTNVTATKSVTANFAIKTFTLTYAAGVNGTLSGTTPQTVNYGASGTAVTAVPATGYNFINWSDDSYANPRTDTNVTANRSVTATFEIKRYFLTYAAGANGSLNGTTPQTVNHGSSGSAVTAFPDTGYSFVNWSDGSTANPRTDTNVTAAKNVTANFAIATFTLTYAAGANGSLAGSTPQTVDYDASGSAVTAVPATGYHFVDWSDGSTANPRTDTPVTANVSVTANFATGGYTLAYAAGANGSLTGIRPQTVTHGTSGSAVTAVPATGYHFVDWSEGSTANPRTDTNVTADLSVTANFAINTYTLTYTAGANGSLTGTTPQLVEFGDRGSAVAAVPATNFHFVDWSDGSTANPRTDTNVTASKSVTANFALTTLSAVNTFTYATGTEVPLTAAGLNVSGRTVNFILNYAPYSGTRLMVVNNTSPGFIQGTFDNLANGAPVDLTFGGRTYHYVAWYYGGDGNDLVLIARDTILRSFMQNFFGSSTATAPVKVDQSGVLAGKTIVSLAAGGGHNVVLCSDGTLAAWGSNQFGQLGDGSITDSAVIADKAVPVLVDRSGVLAGKTIVSLTAGLYHNVVRCSDGTVATWGLNDYGFAFDGDSTTIPTYDTAPVLLLDQSGVLTGKTVVSLATSFLAEEAFNLVLCSDGTVALWPVGSDPFLLDQSGVLAGKTVVSIAAGFQHFVMLCSDGTVAAWGDNQVGQLGDGSTTQSAVPVLVDQSGVLAGKTIVSLAAGGGHNVVLCSDGTLAAWGANSVGQLGDGSTTQSAVPVLVDQSGELAGQTVVSLDAGFASSVALYLGGNGSLLAFWGELDRGAQSNVPVPIFPNVASVDAAYGNLLLAFADIPRIATYTAGSNGTLTGTTSQTIRFFDPGTEVTAVASAGYHFVDWSDGSTDNPRTDSWNPGDLSVTANFLPNPAPEVDVLSPATGLTTGGTSVTIYGINFLGASSVTFGGTEATIVSVADTGISVTSPAHTAGAVNVVVTTPGGSSINAVTFTYEAPPAPVVDVLSPATGPTTGGTSVTIYGINFLGASSVTFGGTAATIVSVTGTGITVTSPAHAAGAVNVVVTTPGGSSTDAATFTYEAAPLSALESWRQTKFGPTATNTGTAADAADPYHTGVPNLLVYAFFGPAQDPATVRSSQLPQATASGGSLSYEFTQPSGVSGLTYGAEWSATLGNDWQPVTDTGIAPVHTFRVPLDGPKKFLRLRVTTQ
ncbi:hypothetical protein IMCC26134_03475 [Verrucomicrobia bacterium IMCC26134]|nr:hypothetical protein IMCC26134_03475 [Verrucomicrobia bacterium IMCC26134]